MCWLHLPFPAMAGVWSIVRLAIASRILTLFIQAVFNVAVLDYDTSPSLSNEALFGTRGVVDGPVLCILGGLHRWDGVHFMGIAAAGRYEHEQSHAFFPLLPAAIRAVDAVLFEPVRYACAQWQLDPLIGREACLIISGAIVANVSFVLAAAGLFLLTMEVCGREALAFAAALAFCANPASVFMSAVYSESAFAALSFWGLLCLERYVRCGRWGDAFGASLLLAAATCTRANGIMTALFPAWLACRGVWTCLSRSNVVAVSTRTSLQQAAVGVFVCICAILPFVALNAHAYFRFCANDEPRAWCSWTLPSVYSFVQSHYWHNGFMRYFRVKQLPNFILAAPMTILCLMGVVWAFSGAVAHHSQAPRSSRPLQRRPIHAPPDQCHNGFGTPALTGVDASFGLRALPYAAHLLALVLGGVLFMHVQVLTRFVACASPAIYWFVGQLWLDLLAGRRVKRARFVSFYYAAYFLLGPLVFSNFYPWT